MSRLRADMVVPFFCVPRRRSLRKRGELRRAEAAERVSCVVCGTQGRGLRRTRRSAGRKECREWAQGMLRPGKPQEKDCGIRRGAWTRRYRGRAFRPEWSVRPSVFGMTREAGYAFLLLAQKSGERRRGHGAAAVHGAGSGEKCGAAGFHGAAEGHGHGHGIVGGGYARVDKACRGAHFHGFACLGGRPVSSRTICR